MEQPIEDADKLYNQNLAIVLKFFASKLPLYYSSSRLTLLLTFLSASGPKYLGTYLIPLPSRLQTADDHALGLHSAGGFHGGDCYWKIFQEFLDSSDVPLALDGQKYTIAALTCLKILFGLYQAPVSLLTWFSQHCRALRIGIESRSRHHHTDLPVGTYRGRSISTYWHLRTHLPNQMRQGIHLSAVDALFELSRQGALQGAHQCSRSNHLQFLLQKSVYSNNILDFARYRVFRFAYLARRHPAYMKKTIFSLAKYIQRVTGETGEVRACESIWGRERWFTAQ
jgi:hypothetical protein